MFFMQILRLVFSLLLIILFANSCLDVKSSDGHTSKPYFDLESLIDGQIEKLNGLNEKGKPPIVYREISFGDQKEKIELNKENESEYPNWEKELLLFKEADINKPILLKAYKEIKTENAIAYEALSPESKVQELKVAFAETEVKKVEISLKTENYLYISSKSMEMQFENGFITNYKILEFRELVTTQAIEYLAITNLTYPNGQ